MTARTASQTKFQLYDQLVAQSATFKPDDWKKFCAIINNLPDDKLEVIYALILHHALHDPTIASTIDTRKPPYSGKLFESGKGVMFKLNNIPPGLQNVIGNYIQSVVSM